MLWGSVKMGAKEAGSRGEPDRRPAVPFHPSVRKTWSLRRRGDVLAEGTLRAQKEGSLGADGWSPGAVTALRAFLGTSHSARGTEPESGVHGGCQLSDRGAGGEIGRPQKQCRGWQTGLRVSKRD